MLSRSNRLKEAVVPSNSSRSHLESYYSNKQNHSKSKSKTSVLEKKGVSEYLNRQNKARAAA